jgi:hypothetical protein
VGGRTILRNSHEITLEPFAVQGGAENVAGAGLASSSLAALAAIAAIAATK